MILKDYETSHINEERHPDKPVRGYRSSSKESSMSEVQPSLRI
jgi:hypothetical protein